MPISKTNSSMQRQLKKRKEKQNKSVRTKFWPKFEIHLYDCVRSAYWNCSSDPHHETRFPFIVIKPRNGSACRFYAFLMRYHIQWSPCNLQQTPGRSSGQLEPLPLLLLLLVRSSSLEVLTSSSSHVERRTDFMHVVVLFEISWLKPWTS